MNIEVEVVVVHAHRTPSRRLAVQFLLYEFRYDFSRLPVVVFTKHRIINTAFLSKMGERETARESTEEHREEAVR